MLELYQLVQLLAIAECGTISKAAEQLHLSQPAPEPLDAKAGGGAAGNPV